MERLNISLTVVGISVTTWAVLVGSIITASDLGFYRANLIFQVTSFFVLFLAIIIFLHLAWPKSVWKSQIRNEINACLSELENGLYSYAIPIIEWRKKIETERKKILKESYPVAEVFYKALEERNGKLRISTRSLEQWQLKEDNQDVRSKAKRALSALN